MPMRVVVPPEDPSFEALPLPEPRRPITREDLAGWLSGADPVPPRPRVVWDVVPNRGSRGCVRVSLRVGCTGVLVLFVGVLFSGAMRGSADWIILGFEMTLLMVALWMGLFSVDDYLDDGSLPRRRRRAARREGAGASHCLPVHADVSGLRVGRTHPTHVDWWQIRGAAPVGDAWDVGWTGGRFRFDPDAAGDRRLVRVILTILEARSRGYLLPDQPDYSVPEGAISPVRMTADEEHAERGISEAE